MYTQISVRVCMLHKLYKFTHKDIHQRLAFMCRVVHTKQSFRLQLHSNNITIYTSTIPSSIFVAIHIIQHQRLVASTQKVANLSHAFSNTTFSHTLIQCNTHSRAWQDNNTRNLDKESERKCFISGNYLINLCVGVCVFDTDFISADVEMCPYGLYLLGEMNARIKRHTKNRTAVDLCDFLFKSIELLLP